jgi:hypothetical protein
MDTVVSFLENYELKMGDGRTVGPREAMEPLRRHKKYSAEK